MGNFSYSIITKDGKEKKGNLEAESKEKAMAQLKAEGNTVLKIQTGSALNKDISFGGRKKVKSKDLSVFCRQFNSLLVAGVGVVPALGMLSDQTENKNLQVAIKNVRDNVEKGDTLATAMKKELTRSLLLIQTLM